MTHIITVTLEELGCAMTTVEVDIAYRYDRGEAQVRYYPDGSGYPGTPESAELSSVYCRNWIVNDDIRVRDDHWLWPLLDRVAYAYAEQHWEELCARCIEDYHDSYDDER